MVMKEFDLLPPVNISITIFTGGFSMKLGTRNVTYNSSFGACANWPVPLSLRSFTTSNFKIFTFHYLGRIYFCRYMSKERRDR